jgi:hypothetical protein
MRKLFAALALLALAVAPVYAQSGTPDGVPLGDYTAAVDTDPALLFWYVGDDTTAAVTVAIGAGGDVTLSQGGAVDTTIECPLSGAYAGVLDVSDAACDTVGELVNVVNGTSGSEWRVMPLNALASDSTDDTLLTIGATEARGDGYVALWDSSVQLTAQVGFFPGVLDVGNVKPDFFAPESARGNVRVNPFAGTRNVLKYAHENITSGGTVVNFVAHCVVPSGLSTSGSYAETVTVPYLEAGAATTVTGLIDEFNYAGGGLVCEDGKFVFRITTDTNLTAQTLFATGFSERK